MSSSGFFDCSSNRAEYELVIVSTNHAHRIYFCCVEVAVSVKDCARPRQQGLKIFYRQREFRRKWSIAYCAFSACMRNIICTMEYQLTNEGVSSGAVINVRFKRGKVWGSQAFSQAIYKCVAGKTALELRLFEQVHIFSNCPQPTQQMERRLLLIKRAAKLSKGRFRMGSQCQLPEASRLRPDYWMSLDGFMQVAM